MQYLRIDDIPDEGLHLEFTTNKEQWLLHLVQNAAREIFSPDNPARVTFFVTRSDDFVNVVGGIYWQLTPTCDRCAEEFVWADQSAFNLMLSPSGKFEGEPEEGDSSGETYFGTYSGGRLRPAELIGEQLVFALPVKWLCSPDCAGLCPKCGENRNLGPCKCAANK